MKLTKELIEKAKTAKTAEELLEMAKSENIELTEEQAAKALTQLNKNGELSDEELDNVAGGCDEFKQTKWKYNVGDHVIVKEQVYTKSDFSAVIVQLLPDPNIGNGHGWYRIIETYISGGQVHRFTGSGWDHAIPESFILGLDPEVAPATRTPSL